MAEPPTGAVTFLFTDIEGSTRLVKLLRDRYGAVLADHQRLLRAAFVAHGGYEVDTQGDSFFVAFSSAREALLAAVEGQLAVLSHSWPEDVERRSRLRITVTFIPRLCEELQSWRWLYADAATRARRGTGRRPILGNGHVVRSGDVEPSTTTTQPSNSLSL